MTALVERFRWTASDPQIDGMGEGPYRREGLISGWTSGNEFAVRAMIPPVRESMYSLPTATLMRSGEWNYGSKSLQEQVGEDRYVPLIAFIALDFKAYTAAMWPDAFPTVLPVVDYLIIPRQQLAPRRLLRRVQDMALASRSDALNVLVRYGSGSIEPGGMLTLDYEEPPADVADFVRSLAPTTGEISRLPAEVVLDRELLAKPALEPDEVEWTWIPPPGPSET